MGRADARRFLRGAAARFGGLVRLRCAAARRLGLLRFRAANFRRFPPKPALICAALNFLATFVFLLAGLAMCVSTTENATIHRLYCPMECGRRIVTRNVVGASVAGLFTFTTLVLVRSNVMSGQYVVTDSGSKKISGSW